MSVCETVTDKKQFTSKKKDQNFWGLFICQMIGRLGLREQPRLRTQIHVNSAVQESQQESSAKFLDILREKLQQELSIYRKNYIPQLPHSNFLGFSLPS